MRNCTIGARLFSLKLLDRRGRQWIAPTPADKLINQRGTLSAEATRHMILALHPQKVKALLNKKRALHSPSLRGKKTSILIH